MLLHSFYIQFMLNPSKFLLSILVRTMYRLAVFAQWCFKHLGQVCSKVEEDVLNQRHPRAFLKDFVINTSFVIFSIIFAGSVNHLPRPDHISYKFLYRYDRYFFGFETSIGSFTGFMLVILGAYLILTKYFNNSTNTVPLYDKTEDDFFFKLKPLNIMDTSEMILTSPSLASDTPSIVSPPSESEILESGLFEFTEESASTIDIPKSKTHHHWRLAPVFLLAISWTVLNILYSTKNPVTKPKNIVAWVFHVVVHFVVPPLFGGWLYIFHPPGALKLFIVSSGLQTVAITLTYLIFPNAPPLFIKLYGENKEPTFDMIYTDGITSVDMRFGVMLHKLSYYAIPNKFASFPSLHSANACLIFFFVCYYSKWSSFKLLGLVNVLGQWWSDLYLDHHWRFDCFAGMLYAITTWVLLKNWKKGLQYVDDRYTNAKANLDMKHGSTMGMRLFRSTRLKNFFDPQV